MPSARGSRVAADSVRAAAQSSPGLPARPARPVVRNLVSGSLYKACSNTVATSIKRTVTNFKVVQLVPIFRLPLNKTRFTLQLSRHHPGGKRRKTWVVWSALLCPGRPALAGAGIPISWRDSRRPSAGGLSLEPPLGFVCCARGLGGRTTRGAWSGGRVRGSGRGLLASYQS